MADLIITVSQVAPDTVGSMVDGIAGATILAGQSVYLDAIASTYKLADANSTAATATAVGIALHNSLAGQPLRTQRGGSPTLGAGAAPVVGTIYCLSATPGGICPAADLASGWRTTILGVGAAGNKLAMSLYVSGQLVP